MSLIQGDTSHRSKPSIDFKTKVALFYTKTFVLMSTGGLAQPEWSPCSCRHSRLLLGARYMAIFYNPRAPTHLGTNSDVVTLQPAGNLSAPLDVCPIRAPPFMDSLLLCSIRNWSCMRILCYFTSICYCNFPSWS